MAAGWEGRFKSDSRRSKQSSFYVVSEKMLIKILVMHSSVVNNGLKVFRSLKIHHPIYHLDPQ